MTIRVIAVDDHPVILKALADQFKSHPDIELVATSQQGNQLLKLVRETNPDVAIVDLGMAGFDPISAVGNLHDQFPNLKILIFTGYDDGLWVRELVRAGASGYILKSDDYSLIIPQAVRSLYQGGKFFSSVLMDKFIQTRDDKGLTDREVSILHMLAQGCSTEVVAAKLSVTEKWIRTQIGKICDKLSIDRSDGVDMRIAAINKARKLGLLPVE